MSVDSISPYLRQQHNQRRRIPGPRREDWDIPVPQQLETGARLKRFWYRTSGKSSAFMRYSTDVDGVSDTPEWKAEPSVSFTVPEFIYIPEPITFSTPTWKAIVQEVCEKHKISYADLASARRDRPVVVARREACWRMRKETSMSLPQIGRRLGGKDHTTVLNAIRKYEEMLKAEPEK